MEFVRKLANKTFGLSIERQAYWQFLRFGIAGGFCAVLEIGSLILLVRFYGEDYLMYFNILAFSFAVIINYLLSRYWVFERGRLSTRVEFSAFVIVSIIALGINQSVLYALAKMLLLNYIIAKILAILVTILWNFTAKKYLVFKK